MTGGRPWPLHREHRASYRITQTECAAPNRRAWIGLSKDCAACSKPRSGWHFPARIRACPARRGPPGKL